ncbi:hypothetical protein [Ramlibacter sp. AN1133]|uniref:hypothetical protein n=1 Tax=Ramlibacter sp. AN1133 TaxID=3133429 RepID=UPI0030C2D3D8
MSERYAALLAEWKTTDRLAREAERALGERYSQFLEGAAAEPTEWERHQVHVLQERARARLKAALEYVASTGPGRARAPGDRGPASN